MDRKTAHRLNEATSEFYAANAASFSGTRERPWDGWRRVLEQAAPLTERSAAEGSPFRVLDIGCGNMRFEKMLVDAFPDQEFEFYATDNCPELACGSAQEAAVHFQQLDVIECLEACTLASRLGAPPCDLAVAFGFMHHVPLREWREELLSTLIEHTAPGGIIAIAFWQFANNEKMAAKAMDATELGCNQLNIALDPSAGDYLLGWQNRTDYFRFCHSYTDDEIDALVRFAATKGATPLASFSADGADGKSNKYLMLER